MSDDVKITFGGEMKELKDELNSLRSDIKGWADDVKGFGIAAFAAWGATKAFDMLKEGIRSLKDEIGSFIDAASGAEEVDAQLAAVVKSTGQAAGFTTEQLQDMATELERLSTNSDEAIKQAQTLMLKFKDIKGEEFKRASTLMVDMGARMGDVVSSANMLGRALNNPIRGMMLMQREGITLSDSQKELVTMLVETGQKAAAQNIIMKELESVYAGANEAAVNTSRGGLKQLYEMLDDVKEEVGRGMIPIINAMVKSFKVDLVPVLEEVAKDWGHWDLDTGEMTTFTSALGSLVRSLSDLALELRNNFLPIVNTLIEKIQEALEMLPNAGKHGDRNGYSKQMDSITEEEFAFVQKKLADAERKTFFWQQQSVLKEGGIDIQNNDDFRDIKAAAQDRQDRKNAAVTASHKAQGLSGSADSASTQDELMKTMMNFMTQTRSGNISNSEDKSFAGVKEFHAAFPDIKASLSGLKEFGQQLKGIATQKAGNVLDVGKTVTDTLGKTAMDIGGIIAKATLPGKDEGFTSRREDASAMFNRIQQSAASLSPQDQRAQKQLEATEAMKRAAEKTADEAAKSNVHLFEIAKKVESRAIAKLG